MALLAYWAITLKLSICSCCPRVSKIVPISREANRPKAMAPSVDWIGLHGDVDILFLEKLLDI